MNTFLNWLFTEENSDSKVQLIMTIKFLATKIS